MSNTKIIKTPEAQLAEKTNGFSYEAEQAKIEHAIKTNPESVYGASHATTPAEPDKQPKGLTTDAVRSITENIHTDIQPPQIPLEDGVLTPKGSFMRTLTEEQLAKIDWGRIDETSMLFSDVIVAKDLKLPSYLDIKLKDPAYVPRWVNRKHDGEGGNRYEQMLAIGYTNARPEDCVSEFNLDRIKIDNNTLICQDLILMKVHKSIIFAIYKANYAKANRRFSKRNVHEEAKQAGIEELRGQLSRAGALSQARGKLSVFIPDVNPLDFE